jgi:hypothetical protein
MFGEELKLLPDYRKLSYSAVMVSEFGHPWYVVCRAVVTFLRPHTRQNSKGEFVRACT